MGTWIGFARTVELRCAILAQAIGTRVKREVLAGDDQARRKTVRGKRMRDWRKLDRFGPGADDQPYVCRMQPSP